MDITPFIESLSDDKVTVLFKNNTLIFKCKEVIAKLNINSSNSNCSFDDNIQISLNNTHKIETNKIEDKILYNTVKDKQLDLYELVEMCKTVVENIYGFCVGCYTKLEFQTDQFITCGNKQCDYILDELHIGSPVVEKIKQDPIITKFIIESGFDAVTCNRKYDIFEPFPRKFLPANLNIQLEERGQVSKLVGVNYDQHKDFNRLESVVTKCDVNKLFGLVDTCYDDQELKKRIGNDTYSLIRFLITSCKADLTINKQLFEKDNAPVQLTVYKVNHPVDKEREFEKLSLGNPSYLFHGSAWCNWYSIMRNGLKNCSNTKLMTAGSAYGQGIYLSSSFTYSSNYGRHGLNTVVGVFEVAGSLDNYCKSGSIHVVKDEKMLIQRYLIIVPFNKLNDKTVKMIDNKFNKQIHIDKSNVKRTVLGKGVRKLVREYKSLTKIGKSLGFRIKVDTDNMYKWLIHLHDFGETELISQDMAKYGVKEVELELSFPNNYPFSPPFMRVIKPRFIRLTGHVTSAGALCMQLLTEKYWDPACSVESLIVTVRSEILEGGGRLDPNLYDVPYPESDARTSFINVSRGHGWI